MHRKLGNFKKIPEILGFYGAFPAVSPIAKFRRFLVKICKKSALKDSTGNSKSWKNFLKCSDLTASSQPSAQ